MSLDDGLTHCQQLQRQKSDALFVGTVESIRYGRVPWGGKSVRIQIVSFSVKESFRGPAKNPLIVRTYAVPGMCGYRFDQGKTYLVDASGPVESLWTYSCGFTQQAEYASNDIRFLEILKGNPQGAVVYGTVKRYVGKPNFVSPQNEPLAGIKLLLTNNADAFTHVETTTDSSGFFKFVQLPESNYSIRAERPGPFLGINTHDFDVKENSCAEMDFRWREVKPSDESRNK